MCLIGCWFSSCTACVPKSMPVLCQHTLHVLIARIHSCNVHNRHSHVHACVCRISHVCVISEMCMSYQGCVLCQGCVPFDSCLISGTCVSYHACMWHIRHVHVVTVCVCVCVCVRVHVRVLYIPGIMNMSYQACSAYMYMYIRPYGR